MKKMIALLLVLTVALGMAACGGKSGGEQTAAENLQGSMEELITAINDKHAKVELPLMSMTLDLSDADAIAYNTGLSEADKITEAAVSEPMMGQPYSLVLVRVAEGTDAAAVAQEMFDNVDGRKWVCMEADTRIAASYGDVAMFFMVSSEFAEQVSTATMLEAFKSICSGEVKVID